MKKRGYVQTVGCWSSAEEVDPKARTIINERNAGKRRPIFHFEKMKNHVPVPTIVRYSESSFSSVSNISGLL
jgi:hypothetical protein